MHNNKIIVNGEVIDNVVSLNLTEDRLRICTDLDNQIVVNDYKVDNIQIDIKANYIQSDKSIRCLYKNGSGEYIGAEGWFEVTMIRDNRLSLVDVDNESWMEIEFNTVDRDYLDQLIDENDGYVYIELGGLGIGNIFNKDRRESVLMEQEEWFRDNKNALNTMKLYEMEYF